MAKSPAKKSETPAKVVDLAKARKARVKVPENETKEDRFKRLARGRVNQALKFISLIGNLSGPGYGYTQEQIDIIKSGLLEAVSSTMKKFAPRDPEGKKTHPTINL